MRQLFMLHNESRQKMKKRFQLTFIRHQLMVTLLLLPLFATTPSVIIQEISAFTIAPMTGTSNMIIRSHVCHERLLKPRSILFRTLQNAKDGDESDTNNDDQDCIGDKIRESTGKRPSLNPTIINTLSQALSLRSSNDPKFPMEVSPTVTALEVAIAAGKLATKAIEKRAMSSKAVKGDESSAFTPEESQLIAGRVVGVVMRWKELEELLIQRVKDSSWVLKYREESSFGVLVEECHVQGDGDDDVDVMVKNKLKGDPLLRMCRAECLYALFLKNVEWPTLKKLGQVSENEDVGVDFLDKDRMRVLFPDE